MQTILMYMENVIKGAEIPTASATNDTDSTSLYMRTLRSVKNTAVKLAKNPLIMEPVTLIATYAINHIFINMQCRMLSANNPGESTLCIATVFGGVTGCIVGGGGGYINGVLNGVAKEELKISAKDPDYVGMNDTQRNAIIKKSLNSAAQAGLLMGASAAAYLSWQ